MKRAFWFMVLLLAANLGYCEGDTISMTIYEYRIVNTSGVALTTAIPTTAIRPVVDKLVGYRILQANSGATDGYCGLYDGTDYASTDFTLGECFGESETTTGYSDGEEWFCPKKIASGVIVQQGANTIVIVYFIRS